MSKINYTVEKIIVKLREVEVLCAKGKIIGEIVRQIGISEQTYYLWRKQYGKMTTSEARRLKELEKNVRLKRIVANQALDLAILRDFQSGNY